MKIKSSLVAIFVAATLVLSGCSGKMSVWNEDSGAMVEMPDKHSANMMYEYQLKNKALEEKWRALASLESDNIVGGMAMAFELGKGDKVSMTRFRTWDERLLPWAQMFFGIGGGSGGGSGIKTLFGETEQSGTSFHVTGDGNDFSGILNRADSRRDTSMSVPSSESHSTSVSTDLEYNKEYNLNQDD